jgi:hypothetical protein
MIQQIKKIDVPAKTPLSVADSLTATLKRKLSPALFIMVESLIEERTEELRKFNEEFFMSLGTANLRIIELEQELELELAGSKEPPDCDAYGNTY